MVAFPPKPEQRIINLIYATIEKEKASDELYLGRIGSSFIGEACIRKIWLDWRGFAREHFEGRMLRLFDTGHRQEERIISDLRKAGFEVWDKQENGEQFEFSDKTGHFITKLDGIIKGIPGSEKTPHLLEIKTHNQNSFTTLQKKGVKEAKPTHYSQMQISMNLGGFTRGLYAAVNKNDEQLYVERIKEDKVEQKKLNRKIISLVEANITPAPISDDASSFECKFCAMKEVCLDKSKALKHCRTCVFCKPVSNGRWLCELDNDMLSIEKQRNGCSRHECI